MKGPFVPGTRWPSPAPLTAPTGSGLGLAEPSSQGQQKALCGWYWLASALSRAGAHTPGHLAGWEKGSGQGVRVSVCPADMSTCLLPARQPSQCPTCVVMSVCSSIRVCECRLGRFSRVRFSAVLWTVAHQAPLSAGLSREEDWSGLPCAPPGDLPHTGIEPASLASPALAGGFFTTSATWDAPHSCTCVCMSVYVAVHTMSHFPHTGVCVCFGCFCV